MLITRAHRLHVLLMLLLAFLLAVLAACSIAGPEDVTTTPGVTDVPEETGEVVGEATVESIEILLLESFPVQVNVVASGTLADSCTSLREPTPRLEGNTFVVNLATSRVEDEVCTQAVVPFDKVIPLPVEGLSAGEYTVSVNGVTDTFTLEVDNVAQEGTPPTDGATGEGTPSATAEATPGDTGEATPAATEPAAEGAPAISGRVWHDMCAVAGGEGGEEAVPSDGCVVLAGTDGGFQANGQMEEDEPGIEGVVLNLGEGECPATGLATATTDADGNYSFADLEPGTYCVSIDAVAEENSTILVPGDWTSPQPQEENTATVTATVEVSEDAAAEGTNFGWDYQFLPDGEETAGSTKDCTDSAEFLADITVQDNEVLPPGFAFTKTWQLENNGTCTWTTDYNLVFVRGDQMAATDEFPIQQEITPTDSIQLSVPMTAPAVNGTYLSEWTLRNELGDPFGIPGTFYVQIVVTSALPTDGAYIHGIVWQDLCTPPAEGAETPESCVAQQDGTFVADGEYDVGEGRLAGITVGLSEGACPANNVLTTTTTGRNGRYIFRQLDPGSYCVFVDPEAANNASSLSPGRWTWPEVSQEPVGITVEVAENEGVSNIYFAWDPDAE